MDPLSPDDPVRIGPYRLLGRLGAGGMGRVYLARSQGGRTVAVKLVQGEFAAQEEFRRRFAQEVAAARRVGGEWTAPVLDADTEADIPWLATGYVPGPPLNAVIGTHGPLPESSLRVLAHRLARALEAVHTAGIVHRDLKPSNVLLTVDGPRVIDFGIARALDTVVDAARTRTGVVVGSPGFMSPEQVRGQRVTAVSDVFCLGSVLAFAATGRPPFGAADAGLHALLYRVAFDEPDLAGLPVGIADVVRDCLAKDPAARPSPSDVARRTEPPAETERTERTAALEPWLPGALLAELGRHAARLLDTDSVATEPSPAPQRPPGPTAAQPPAHHEAPPAPAAASSPAPPHTGTLPIAPAPPRRDSDTPPLGTRVPRPRTGPVPAAQSQRPTATTPAATHAAHVTHATRSPAPPVPTAPPRRLRTALFGAGGVVVAAVIALLAVNLPFNSEAGDHAKTRDSSAAAASSPAPSGAPPDLLGTWEGQVTSHGQQAVQYVRLALPDYDWPSQSPNAPSDAPSDKQRQSPSDEATGRDGPAEARLLLGTGNELCEVTATLRQRTDDRAVLDSAEITRVRPADAPDAPCALPGRQTVTTTAQGLHWVSGDMSADLTRANTGKRVVPTDYLGTWRRAASESASPGSDAGTGPNGSEDMTVTFSQGPVGTPVVRTTGTAHGKHCTWTETLISVRDGIMVMGPYEVVDGQSDDGCPSGPSHIYIAEDDGTIDVGDATSLASPRVHLERAD